MGDPSNMPPLSGEIMAADPIRTSARSEADVVDAEYVTLPRWPLAPAAPRKADAGPVPAGLDVLLRSGGPKSRRAGIGFWTTGAMIAVAAFWMSGGHTLSRHLPLPGDDGGPLRIADVSSRIAGAAGGRTRLFVDGEVRNVAKTRVASPDLTIDVIANDGIVTRYRLATGSGPMGEGEARRFSSRLAAPEAGVRSVAVAIDRKELD